MSEKNNIFNANLSERALQGIKGILIGERNELERLKNCSFQPASIHAYERNMAKIDALLSHIENLLEP